MIFDRWTVGALAAGDPEAWNRIIDEWAPRLINYASKVWGLSQEDAEDSVQEIWIAIIRAISNGTSTGELSSAYFYAAVRNAAIRKSKKSARYRGDVSIDALMVAVGGDDLATEPVLKEEGKHLVLMALETLTDRQRQAIHLRYFDDRTFVEIAIVMGCPLGTAISHVRRGKKKLRQRLECLNESIE